MNFHLVILFSVVACAFALPIPDEEVAAIKKDIEDAVEEAVTAVEDLVKPEPSSITVEEGANAVVANVTVVNLPKVVEPVVGKSNEPQLETITIAEDDIKEVPKSLPVVAKKGTEAVVPPFAGVRAEPKEGVEITEAKSTASSPGVDEIEKKAETKPIEEVKPNTESNADPASVEKKTEIPPTEEKPKPEGIENKSSSTKPAVAGENKTEDSASTATETKKTDKSNAKSKPTELTKEKHDHNSEESAESKESEESGESNKSK